MVAKQRVYELARDLGMESKDVLARAQELGLHVKTASSGLDEDGVALVRLSYEDEGSAGETSPPAEAAHAAAQVEMKAEVGIVEQRCGTRGNRRCRGLVLPDPDREPAQVRVGACDEFRVRG